jgi:hypothetical protein
MKFCSNNRDILLLESIISNIYNIWYIIDTGKLVVRDQCILIQMVNVNIT